MVWFLTSVLPMCTTVARSGVKPAYQASRFLPTQSAWSGHWLRCAQASQVPVLLAAGRPPASLFFPPEFSITVAIALVAEVVPLAPPGGVVVVPQVLDPHGVRHVDDLVRVDGKTDGVVHGVRRQLQRLLEAAPVAVGLRAGVTLVVAHRRGGLGRL